MILVTGGAGFIGSNFVLDWLGRGGEPVVNVDLLTYSGNLDNLAALDGNPAHVFVQSDICDSAAMRALLDQHTPRAIIHFAAESHVDRSIDVPGAFVRTNIDGTFSLLEAARGFWEGLDAGRRSSFRFLHVSTDEVFGTLGPADPAFQESTPYAPNSPYSASKAGSDHLVRAYHHTYGLPTLVTNCSNNYGPFQHPEKLIPRVITSALAGLPLPVYGDGLQVRDWLYVRDHCEALCRVLEDGKPGSNYNIGGNSEKANIEVVKLICSVLDELRPDPEGAHARLITHVRDRPGHDRRYAVNTYLICREIGWSPSVTFEDGLRETVKWYLNNTAWLTRLSDARRNGDECRV